MMQHKPFDPRRQGASNKLSNSHEVHRNQTQHLFPDERNTMQYSTHSNIDSYQWGNQQNADLLQESNMNSKNYGEAYQSQNINIQNQNEAYYYETSSASQIPYPNYQDPSNINQSKNSYQTNQAQNIPMNNIGQGDAYQNQSVPHNEAGENHHSNLTCNKESHYNHSSNFSTKHGQEGESKHNQVDNQLQYSQRHGSNQEMYQDYSSQHHEHQNQPHFSNASTPNAPSYPGPDGTYQNQHQNHLDFSNASTPNEPSYPDPDGTYQNQHKNQPHLSNASTPNEPLHTGPDGTYQNQRNFHKDIFNANQQPTNPCESQETYHNQRKHEITEIHQPVGIQPNKAYNANNCQYSNVHLKPENPVNTTRKSHWNSQLNKQQEFQPKETYRGNQSKHFTNSSEDTSENEPRDDYHQNEESDMQQYKQYLQQFRSTQIQKEHQGQKDYQQKQPIGYHDKQTSNVNRTQQFGSPFATTAPIQSPIYHEKSFTKPPVTHSHYEVDQNLAWCEELNQNDPRTTPKIQPQRRPDVQFATSNPPSQRRHNAKFPTPNTQPERRPDAQFATSNTPSQRQPDTKFATLNTQLQRRPETQFASLNAQPQRRPNAQFETLNTQPQKPHFYQRGSPPLLDERIGEPKKTTYYQSHFTTPQVLTPFDVHSGASMYRQKLKDPHEYFSFSLVHVLTRDQLKVDENKNRVEDPGKKSFVVGNVSHIPIHKTPEEEIPHCNYFVKAYDVKDLKPFIKKKAFADLQHQRIAHVKSLPVELQRYGASHIANYSKKYFNGLVEDYCHLHNINISKLRKSDRAYEKLKRGKLLEYEKIRDPSLDQYGNLFFVDVAHVMPYDKYRKLWDEKAKHIDKLRQQDKDLGLKQATYITKQYFARLIVAYCGQQNVDLSTLGCKVTVNDAKALVPWPTLDDTADVDPREVHKLRFYKRYLYDIMSEEIFLECQNVRAQLLSELTRDHAKSDLTLSESVENMKKVTMVADRYYGDLIKAFLQIHNYAIGDFMNDSKRNNRPNNKESVKPKVDYSAKADKTDKGKPDRCSNSSSIRDNDAKSDRHDSRIKKERKDSHSDDKGKSLRLSLQTKPKCDYRKDEPDPEFNEIPDEHKYRKYSFSEMYDLLRGNRAVYNTLERERTRYSNKVLGNAHGVKNDQENTPKITDKKKAACNLIANIYFYQSWRKHCQSEGIPIPVFHRIIKKSYHYALLDSGSSISSKVRPSSSGSTRKAISDLRRAKEKESRTNDDILHNYKKLRSASRNGASNQKESNKSDERGINEAMVFIDLTEADGSAQSTDGATSESANSNAANSSGDTSVAKVESSSSPTFTSNVSEIQQCLDQMVESISLTIKRQSDPLDVRNLLLSKDPDRLSKRSLSKREYRDSETAGIIPNDVLREYRKRRTEFFEKEMKEHKIKKRDIQKDVRKELELSSMIYFNKLVEHYCVQNDIKISSLFDNERKSRRDAKIKDRKRSSAEDRKHSSSSSSKRSRAEDKKIDNKPKHASKDKEEIKQSGEKSSKNAEKSDKRDDGPNSENCKSKDKKEDQPRSHDQLSSRDQSKSRDQSSSHDQPRSRDQSTSRDQPSSCDQSLSCDQPRSRDQSTSRDQPRSRDQSTSRDQPRSREQSKSRDQPSFNEQSTSHNQPRSRDQSKSSCHPSSNDQSMSGTQSITINNKEVAKQNDRFAGKQKEPLCNIFPRSQVNHGGRKMKMYSNNEMIGIIPREVIVECRRKRDAYFYESMRLSGDKKKATKKEETRGANKYFNELVEKYCSENNINMERFIENRRMTRKKADLRWICKRLSGLKPHDLMNVILDMNVNGASNALPDEFKEEPLSEDDMDVDDEDCFIDDEERVEDDENDGSDKQSFFGHQFFGGFLADLKEEILSPEPYSSSVVNEEAHDVSDITLSIGDTPKESPRQEKSTARSESVSAKRQKAPISSSESSSAKRSKSPKRSSEDSSKNQEKSLKRSSKTRDKSSARRDESPRKSESSSGKRVSKSPKRRDRSPTRRNTSSTRRKDSSPRRRSTTEKRDKSPKREKSSSKKERSPRRSESTSKSSSCSSREGKRHHSRERSSKDEPKDSAQYIPRERKSRKTEKEQADSDANRFQSWF
ncbi:uncharacterized protein [Clytia hemisphaerica]|uniref:Uncharacterized protein n=2 Tax=Clytia hemisphaerica TaxID=252671 RepID=A0A7M5VE54_9CNID